MSWAPIWWKYLKAPSFATVETLDLDPGQPTPHLTISIPQDGELRLKSLAQLGWRKPRIPIQSTVKGFASAIQAHLDREQITQLIEAIQPDLANQIRSPLQERFP